MLDPARRHRPLGGCFRPWGERRCPLRLIVVEHDRFSHCHGLEHLEPGAAADVQGDDDRGSARDFRREYSIDVPYDADRAAGSSHAAITAALLLADDAKANSGKPTLLELFRKDLAEKEQDAGAVGVVIDGTKEQDSVAP